jgi:oligopeptide transport system permease protein
MPADRVLPALTIGLVYAAVIARITRGGMLEVLSQDFIRTAKAKGVPFFRIVVFHTLKGGLLPVLSFLGPALAGIISGSFVVETVFQIPGMGRQFVQSAFNRDYTLVLGTVILFAVLITVANLLVDIIQVIINPRLRFEDS